MLWFQQVYVRLATQRSCSLGPHVMLTASWPLLHSKIAFDQVSSCRGIKVMRVTLLYHSDVR